MKNPQAAEIKGPEISSEMNGKLLINVRHANFLRRLDKMEPKSENVCEKCGKDHNLRAENLSLFFLRALFPC